MIAVDLGARRRRARHGFGGGENLSLDRRDDRDRPDAVGRGRRRGSNSCRPRRSCSTAPGCAATRASSWRAGAGFLGGGIIVFGRRARGERFTDGLLHEVWEVRRDGALVWGDALHVDGDVAAIDGRPGLFRRRRGLRDADPGAARARPARFARRCPRGAAALAGAGLARRRRRRSTACWSRAGSAPTRCRCAAPMPISLAICATPRWDCRRACRGVCGTFDAAERPMNLTPREKDKLLVSVAAMVAERRLEARRQAQLPRGGGADHRLRARRRARRQDRRRTDARRRHGASRATRSWRACPR